MNDEHKYSMRFVVQRTGLSPHVIRAWERRYGAIAPERTSTNRRLYTDRDVERLELLRQAISLGHSIGQIATLPLDKLRSLAEVKRAEEQSDADSAELSKLTGAAEYLDACLTAIISFDLAAFEGALLRASVGLSQPVLIDDLVVPLIHKIGRRWQQGLFRIAHEHFASMVVRTFLGNMRAAFEVPAAAPTIIVTTPIAQIHELGALIVAVTAAAEGWRALYLGPNLPAAEIAGAAELNHAKAVALSLVYPTDDPRVIVEFTKLRQSLAREVRIITGGRAVDYYKVVLQRIGAVRLNSIRDFREILNEIG